MVCERRKASGSGWPMTSRSASQSGCSSDRFGSRDATFTAASATARPESWTSSWRRAGSAANRAASPRLIAVSIVTPRSYGYRLRCGISREREQPPPSRGRCGRQPDGGDQPRGRGSKPAPRPMRRTGRRGDAGTMTSETLKHSVTTTAADGGEPVPAPRLGIVLIALAAVALELVVSARYGYVRDELYFLAAGQHLAPGYVDQPALTPLLARFSSIVFGNTVVGLRVLPALSLGVIVILTAAMSRRLGAGRAGQLLAAAAAATCAQFVGAAHELTTTVPDFLLWAVALYLVVRLLDSGNPRWWLAIGLTVGVFSAAKWNIAFLVALLAVGFAATDGRRLLRSRYLLLGCLLASVLA